MTLPVRSRDATSVAEWCTGASLHRSTFRPVRARLLLAGDHRAVRLPRSQISTTGGDDPLTPAARDGWAGGVTAVNRRGAFMTLAEETLP